MDSSLYASLVVWLPCIDISLSSDPMLSLRGCLDHSFRLTIGYSTSGFYAHLRYHLFKNSYIMATGYSGDGGIQWAGPNYLDSDDHLVQNDHHAAPDLTTKKIALGTLSVHDLAVAASFSGTWPLFVQDRRLEAGRCFEVAGPTIGDFMHPDAGRLQLSPRSTVVAISI
ncbi:uncharacterized protein ARMOST_16121 [Armillaria ostoyae]|uniref:Uncharacterized protein n=1 Tax=Armillaria ostoyae TaxID=47428 RepID=A0A284RVB4_ARMOS|nr:uncharacterized protein ARMOST_16121 [Armillaria ostoyae]